MAETMEYRVVWKRQGIRRKTKRFARRATAEKFVVLLGPEPWRAFTDRDPDDPMCCSGHECGCGGLSVREHSDETRKNIPPLESAVIEERPINPFAWRLSGGTPR